MMAPLSNLSGYLLHLAASVFPARAARSSTRAHRALPVAFLVCLVLFASCAAPARAAGGLVNDYFDELRERDMATALAVGCVDAGWTGAVYNPSDRFAEIRLPHAGLNGTLPFDIVLIDALLVLDLRGDANTGDITAGSAMRALSVVSLGCLLLSAVCAAGSSTRAHGALPVASLVCLVLFASCAAPARAAGCLVNDYFDELTERDMATALAVDCVDAGWTGAVYNPSDRVSEIRLPHAGLNGTLPSDIVLIDALLVLDLRGNAGWTGAVYNPSDRVSEIRLPHAGLNGTLPSDIGLIDALLVLDLRGNAGWTGAVYNPSDRVSVIRLPHAGLNGTLPSDIVLIDALLVLDLRGNAGWTGAVYNPSDRVSEIRLPHAGLNGTLPSDIGLIDALLVLDLRGNAGWTGAVYNPSDRVSEIRLPHAGLNGTLPSDIGLIDALLVLDLRGDANTGDITAGSAMRALSVVSLGCLLLSAACAAGSRAHRALSVASFGCLVLFSSCAVPARAAGGDYYPHTDDSSMRAIATALGTDRALGWTNDTSPCVDGWIGVLCDTRGRVMAIHARNASLNGTLPLEIGELESLQELDLRENSIAGDVPDVVFLEITRLRLDGNSFTSVPVGFLASARSLQLFSISNNSHLRSWELPNGQVRFDTTLQEYIADHAQLTGTLSRFLGNSHSFNKLNVLSLAYNQLTGEVPSTFASQTLTHLDLSYNALTGPVDFIASLPELEVLRLEGNQFTGPLPDFSGHWSLRVVEVAQNRLTGVVPASLVRLEGLSSVSIAYNLFQGSVPVFAGSVHSDMAEAAAYESFCRPDPGPCDKQVQSFLAIAGAFRFPEAFASSWKGNRPCAGWLGVYCDQGGVITGLNFGRLGLTGTLHPAFGEFKSLLMIVVAGNNITGNVPGSIAALPSLRLLDISNNSLSGTMPTFRSDVTVWAGGNENLTVAGASGQCISDPMFRFVAAAAAAVVALVLA